MWRKVFFVWDEHLFQLHRPQIFRGEDKTPLKAEVLPPPENDHMTGNVRITYTMVKVAQLPSSVAIRKRPWELFIHGSG